MSDLDPPALAKGVFVALAIALPARLIADVVEGSARNLVIVLIYVALGLGGYVAGQKVPVRAITHGGIVGALAAIPVQATSIALTVGDAADGRSNSPITGAAFSVLIAASCGILGGYLAFRRSRQSDDAGNDAVRR